jgi:hypothetical protein
MQKPRYFFYLNPHQQYAWTKCPKCDNKTKVRKYYLMIHYGEKARQYNQMFSLGKTCKFCPYCELIIANKWEVEDLLAQMLGQLGKKFDPKNYFIFGTTDRVDWKTGMREATAPGKALEQAYPFRNVWDFEIRPAGWYFDGE